MSEYNINNLVINDLTEVQYEAITTPGTDEIYMTPASDLINYNTLTNKPTVNGQLLQGNITVTTDLTNYYTKSEALQVIADNTESRTATYTTNGTYTLTPASGKVAFGDVTVNVSVEGGGTGKPEETFTVTPTNTAQTVTPRTGYVFSSGTVNGYDVDTIYDSLVNLNTGTPTQSYTVPNGMKFGNSTFSTVPSNLDFSNLTNFSGLFYNCGSLTTVPSTVLSNITGDISNMLYNCYSLNTLPTIDCTNVTSLSYTFYGDSNLTSLTLTNTDSVTNLSYAFRNSGIQNLTLGSTASVTNWNYAFGTNLRTVTPLNMTGATSLYYAFSGASRLSAITLNNTSNITDFRYCFSGCSSLGTISIGSTASATQMTRMFQNCTSLISPTIDMVACTTAEGMFYGCSSMTTATVTNSSLNDSFGSWFWNCTSLTSITGLNTAAATDYGSMFRNCPALQTVELVGGGIPNNMDNMFNGDGELRSVKTIPLQSVTSQYKMSGMFYNSSGYPYLTELRFSGFLNYTLDLQYCTALDFDSIVNVLETATASGVTTSSKTLTFNVSVTDVDDEVADLVALATGSYGWTINGLTIL